jgi:hypothetical protein
MTPFRVIFALVLVIVAMLLAAGCAGPAEQGYQTTPGIPTIQASVPYNINTVKSPEGTNSAYIGLNSDVFNQGDDVEFTVVIGSLETSVCENYLPTYGIAYLAGGSWKYLSEPRETLSSAIFDRMSGSSQRTFRFNTANITPGRYRIQFDCGPVSREFLIREAGTQVSIPCPVLQKTTPWINISPVYDAYAGEVIELKGTTTLPPGTNLLFFIIEPYARSCPFGGCDYTSISGNMTVMSGDCGINTWSYALNLSGVNPTCDIPNCQPSHYLISVMTKDRAVINSTLFKIHGGQRPLNNYLTFDIIRGKAFSYHGFAPDPSLHTIASNSTTDTVFISNATISEVHVWIFGNKYANMTVYPVNPDKSFNVTLTSIQTAELASGSYRMLFQYPRMGNQFDIRIKNGTYTVINPEGEEFLNYYDIPDSKITGFKVMDMLEQELKKPDSHDRYSIISIAVGDSPNVVTPP